MMHYPVMLPEVLGALDVKSGGVFVDGTLGAGGYSRGILSQPESYVYGVDRDPAAKIVADELGAGFGDRFTFLPGCFGDVAGLLTTQGSPLVDGFVLDVGVSSMQIDQDQRGFSFQKDGPLDMRMDNAGGDRTAANLVNELGEAELADLIYEYGEERHSRKIARRIVGRRSEQVFERTLDLAQVVRDAVPNAGREKIDPATRTFQALRVAVNDELGELRRALEASLKILKQGGRLVVVTFHSLEDRIVKSFMRKHAGVDGAVSRHMPEALAVAPLLELPVKKAILPSEQEVQENARSRSARLRFAIRTASPEGGAL